MESEASGSLTTYMTDLQQLWEAEHAKNIKLRTWLAKAQSQLSELSRSNDTTQSNTYSLPYALRQIFFRNQWRAFERMKVNRFEKFASLVAKHRMVSLSRAMGHWNTLIVIGKFVEKVNVDISFIRGIDKLSATSSLVSKRFLLTVFSRVRGAYLIVNDEDFWADPGSDVKRAVRLLMLNKYLLRKKLSIWKSVKSQLFQHGNNKEYNAQHKSLSTLSRYVQRSIGKFMQKWKRRTCMRKVLSLSACIFGRLLRTISRRALQQAMSIIKLKTSSSLKRVLNRGTMFKKHINDGVVRLQESQIRRPILLRIERIRRFWIQRQLARGFTVFQHINPSRKAHLLLVIARRNNQRNYAQFFDRMAQYQAHRAAYQRRIARVFSLMARLQKIAALGTLGDMIKHWKGASFSARKLRAMFNRKVSQSFCYIQSETSHLKYFCARKIHFWVSERIRDILRKSMENIAWVRRENLLKVAKARNLANKVNSIITKQFRAGFEPFALSNQKKERSRFGALIVGKFLSRKLKIVMRHRFMKMKNIGGSYFAVNRVFTGVKSQVDRIQARRYRKIRHLCILVKQNHAQVSSSFILRWRYFPKGPALRHRAMWRNFARRAFLNALTKTANSITSTTRIQKAAKTAFYQFILERFALFPKRYQKRLAKTGLMKIRYAPASLKVKKPKITKFSAYKLYQFCSTRLQTLKYECMKKIVSLNRKRIYAEAQLRKISRMNSRITTYNKTFVFSQWTKVMLMTPRSHRITNPLCKENLLPDSYTYLPEPDSIHDYIDSLVSVFKENPACKIEYKPRDLSTGRDPLGPRNYGTRSVSAYSKRAEGENAPPAVLQCSLIRSPSAVPVRTPAKNLPLPSPIPNHRVTMYSEISERKRKHYRELRRV